VKALAWAEWQRTVCPDCRTRLAEWDPDRGGDRNAYVTDTLRCPGCELIEQERNQVPHDRSGHGVKVQLMPREQWLHLHQDEA
jgi:hypothetical protein